MLLGTKQADALGLGPGDEVTVTFPETGDVALTVAATFERDSLIGSAYVVSLQDFVANVTSTLDEAVLVSGAEGPPPAAVKDSVKKALGDYPNVVVSDPAELTKEAQARSTRCSAS